ncbi:NifB/NifX family molybdenum-iron cluster-binding protein [Methanobacterium sp.]|uniref:NifB/NifX family molybdenum-iron cluster-binding protein n=1 Tax=Methanobacterium sp. TaxID=2164 RepID=UPI0025F3DC98|nr:NifB/NifX family molybdenum-iron cluster-binding protein [Methanobacterium sp.]MBI5460376.1 dinitrogenase iron-molybdenum cofactor biosynthesis protein [Methanobacterium sp.]
MSIKVAAASSDGKHVNQHFGKAQKFLIFEIKDNGKYEFIELRETDPRCGGDPDLKEKTINLISDCDILLVSQIGTGAREKLLNRGVRPVIMPVFIEDALEKVYSLIQND